MRTPSRALLGALLLLAIPTPAGASTPSSGAVSLASPTASWTGEAPGYGVTAVNIFARTCVAPACDSYDLTVGDAGDLTVSVAQKPGSGFVSVEVVKPDGTSLSNETGAGEPTAQLTIKSAPAGLYQVHATTNSPAAIGDASYTGTATLGAAAPGGGAGGVSGPAPSPPAGTGEGGPKDATVIAVIDVAMDPYHWDFLASRTPENSNADTGDDLPLDRPATEWLPGFADSAAGFKSFSRLDLSIEENDPKQSLDDLRALDADRLAAVKPSTPTELNAVWMPGTKVIGALSFNSAGTLFAGSSSHGAGTTSSAVGNIHGTCPECLLFFIHSGSTQDTEAAIDWAMKQPWIDAISNSYGFGSNDVYGRDRIYSGSNTSLQRTATERGQTVFFSAGNGVENAFLVPNSTTFSSQEGPDWIVTVGAVSTPADGYYDPIADAGKQTVGPYIGAGKPADIAGVGSDYPTSYDATTVSETGSIGFSGTSNATPQIAGLYGHTLYRARKALAGASATQSGGVVASGAPIACGAARPSCELGDGVLTAAELRTRLFRGAAPSRGPAVSGQGLVGDLTLHREDETSMLGEGYGAYLGRVTRRTSDWEAENDRVLGPMLGTRGALTRPDGEREWFIVDSYCRQKNWGSWGGGDYVAGRTTVPGDARAWPIRSARARTCPGGPVPVSLR